MHGSKKSDECGILRGKKHKWSQGRKCTEICSGKCQNPDGNEWMILKSWTLLCLWAGELDEANGLEVSVS